MLGDQYLVFHLDEQPYALPLYQVDRVVWMVQILPLPHAPVAVLGVVNVQGRVLPVLNLRHWLRLPPRPLALDDHLILAHTAPADLVLPVDRVIGVQTCPPEEQVPASAILPALAGTEGVSKSAAGLIVILDDLEGLLALIPPDLPAAADQIGTDDPAP
jgi:purine-binding chemotaxis protein CheW